MTPRRVARGTLPRRTSDQGTKSKKKAGRPWQPETSWASSQEPSRRPPQRYHPGKPPGQLPQRGPARRARVEGTALGKPEGPPPP